MIIRNFKTKVVGDTKEVTRITFNTSQTGAEFEFELRSQYDNSLLHRATTADDIVFVSPTQIEVKAFELEFPAGMHRWELQRKKGSITKTLARGVMSLVQQIVNS